MTQNDFDGVKRVIDRYLSAYEERNLDAVEATIAHDKAVLGIGTDEGEFWKGWTEIKSAKEKQLAAITETTLNRGHTEISFAQCGKVAWFAEELSGDFWVQGNKTTCHLRFTGVLEKRDNKWVIVQFHRSMPVKGFAVPYLETHGVRFD
ncbi:MAG: nuclear transport factor 2 family protein [Pseudomonadota bacterium]